MSGNGRVRRLRLSLELDTANDGEADSWRTHIEREFIHSLLEVCTEILHQRFGPETLICIRQLHLRLDLDPEALFAPEEAARQGRLLADRLAPSAQPDAIDGLPDPHANIAVFRSEAHRRAVLIAERSSGKEPGWYQGRNPSRRPLADWLERGPEQVVELLEWAARLGAADDLFTGDQLLIAALAGVVPPEQWPAEVLRAAAQATPPPAGDGPSPLGRPFHHAAQSESDATGVTQASVTSGDEVTHAPEEPAPTPGPARTRPGSRAVEPSPRPSAKIPAPGVHPAPPLTIDDALAQPAEHSMPSVMRGQEVHTDRSASPESAPVEDQASPGEPGVAADRVPSLGLETAFGGLFYLVGRVLELELGEQLWCAGLQETEVLYHAARLLVGPAGEGDPAPAVFAGTDPDSPIPVPAVEEWSLAEVREKVLGTLSAEFVRRLGESPAAPSIAAELDALARDLLQRLPIDSTGAPEQLIGLAAAAPALLFLRRAGFPEGPAGLEPALAVPATLLLPEGRLLVTMPMSAIDLDLRRAGLDQNPGWTPWMERKVELQYL